MKTKILILSVLGFVLGGGWLFAQWEEDLSDVINQAVQQEEGLEQKSRFEFQTFSSCEDLEIVLKKWLKENEDLLKGYPWYPYPILLREESLGFDAVEGMAAQKAVTPSNSTDFSKTNVQVKGIDEPDILKSDGKYLYYFSSKYKKVYIIKAPLDFDSKYIDLSTAQILKSFKLPKNFDRVQLFVKGEKLIIYWNYYKPFDDTSILWNTKTIVLVMDVSNLPKTKLLRLSVLDWEFSDARLIDNQLVVFTNIYPRYQYFYKPIKILGKEVTTVTVSPQKLLPRAIDVVYDPTNWNLKIKGKKLPYKVGADKVDCKNIYYSLPDKDTLSQLGSRPSFSVVYRMDIEDSQNALQTNAIFGDSQTQYVSHKSVYLISSQYFASPYRCGPAMRCILPIYPRWENALISKFSLTQATHPLEYRWSALVSWRPLNQYALHEDQQEYFYIITKHWDPEVHTNLFVLDPEVNLYGSLEDIEPGEEFKASRFIGDKLYLVTFKQVDPLFVIDLADKQLPKIIGKLKIPGYSKYLHPYAQEKNWVQYLIGLWYATEPRGTNWVINKWVKIDLYKVDYNHTTSSGEDKYIEVKQLFTKELGDKGSRTEALDNPRTFVWDENRKLLLLPMILSQQVEDMRCYVDKWYDREGNMHQTEKCYPYTSQKTTFVGVKGFTIDLTSGILESISKNYKSTFEVILGGDFSPWRFRQLNFRVGYVGDVVYSINNYFIHFFVLGKDIEKYLYFDKSIQARVPTDKWDKTQVNKKCYWEPPKPWTITCQMYCWERRVLWEDGKNCEAVTVSAACSCPGFDTKQECEKACLK